MKKLGIAISFALALGTLFTNCGEFAAQRGRSQFFAEHPVFGTSRADVKFVLASTQATNNEEPLPPVPPVPPPPGEPDTLPVKYECSTRMTQNFGYNLATVPNPTVRISTPEAVGGVEVCKFNGTSIKEKLVSLKILDLDEIKTNCPNLAAGQHGLTITSDTSKTSVIYEASPKSREHGILLTVERSATSYKISQLITPEYENRYRSGKHRGSKAWVLYNFGDGYDIEGCDYKHSPLIVALYERGSIHQIRLRPPSRGIKFDILGGNAQPTPHSKDQISWFMDGESAASNAWIVKPNANYEVTGIDEMFGDNTLGPDGRYAANGFQALAKYDDNRDGRINISDRVYSSLALWTDYNLDGKSQREELRSFRDMGVDWVDLNYDPNFAEEDVIGNKILYKSTIHFRNSSESSIVYDLWFRIQPK